jgi:prepilin signal peptidase PulO-like enzyme (type II secretory pathway)
LPGGYLLIAGATLLTFASFLAIEPVIKRSSEPPPARMLVEPIWLLIVQQRLLEGITGAWFFMLGASFGSFLHCLEYRWPRKISLVARGSACPGCGTAIHLWHNVPVFGWLWLRGRCARCGWEIPARYALTELVFGLTFVLLMSLELISGGANLPFHSQGRGIGVTENIWDPNWPLIATFALHAGLMLMLLTWSLFAWDRFGLPISLAVGAVIVGSAAPLCWPLLQPVAWDGLANAAESARLRIAVGQCVGASAGLLLGNSLVRRTPGNIRAGDVAPALLGMLLVGLILGWQAAVAVALLATIIRGLLSFSSARSWPVVASIALATLIQLAAWRWLTELPCYPGLRGGQLISTLALIVAVPLAASLVDGSEAGGDAGPTILTQPAQTASASIASTSPASLPLTP